MMDRPAVTVVLFRARVAILIVWHITQLCVWLLAHLVVLSGVLFLIVGLGIGVLEGLGVPIGYLINNN